MRSVTAALLSFCLLACSSENAPQPKPKAVENSVPEPVSTAAAPGGALRGEVSALRSDVTGLTVRVTRLGTILELPTDTLFEFDRWELGPEAEGNLTKAANAIRAARPGPIEIIGHTDAKGEDAYNNVLSTRRAEAVAAWLRQQVGVRQRQILVSGKGEAAPIAPNASPDGRDDPEGRSRNRRVEILIRTE